MRFGNHWKDKAFSENISANNKQRGEIETLKDRVKDLTARLDNDENAQFKKAWDELKKWHAHKTINGEEMAFGEYIPYIKPLGELMDEIIKGGE